MSEVVNPWTADAWNITAQGEYVKRYGVSVATRTAKLAGSFLGATKPKQDHRQIEVRNFILTKKIGSTGGSGNDTGLIGAGRSGEGPPE